MTKLLQCGYPKSGNSLLYNILSNYQKLTGTFSSFNEKAGFTQSMQTNEKDKLLFKNHEYVDNFIVKNNQIYVLYPNTKNRQFKVDINSFINTSSLLWTHQRAADFINQPLMSKVGKMFYVCRDPRAVYISMCHHVVRPEYLRLLPMMKIKNAPEIMKKKDLTEKWICAWRDNIRDYLKYKNRFILLKYEELVSNKRQVLHNIIKNIDGKIDEANSDKMVKHLLKTTDLHRMMKENPEHVRKGKIDSWQEEISSSTRQFIEDTTQKEMQFLGYNDGKV
jgi:hypothetical protein